MQSYLPNLPLVHHLFEAAVEKFPDSVALRFGSKTFSYQELNLLANQIGNSLINNNAKPGDIIGLCFERSFESIASILAVLKIGCAYLPLDPEYPQDRLEYMVANAEAKIILGHSKLIKNIQTGACTKLSFNINEVSEASSSLELSLEVNPSAYIIYTSGSTGRPKGVDMGHQALTNLILWQNKQTSLKAGKRTLQFTPISFDVHFQEIFSTLSLGGELVLISEAERLNSLELLKIIEKQEVNRLFLPFVALNHLAEMASQYGIFPKNLLEITTAGEQLKITDHLIDLFDNLDNAKLFNHYGPSESHVVTSLTLNGNASSWDKLPAIGREIDNSQVYILDDNLNEVEAGKEGELYLAGVCLAKGYINNQTMTEERFIEHSSLGRVYKTGDLGLRLESGDIVYHGRTDGQVKIRGYRIELGEIELALEKASGISDVAVKVIETKNGDKSICAYLIGEFDISKLRESLKELLPEYMLPSNYVKMETFPLTPSGKLDRKSLPQPSNKRPQLEVEYTKASSKLESTILLMWEKYLALEGIGVLDNFFDLGGNSLLALKILAELEESQDIKISIVNFFQYPTIRSLSEYKNGKKVSKENRYQVDKDRTKNSDIAIIAMTGRFPGAEDIDSLWQNLLESKNSVEKFDKTELCPSVPSELANNPNYICATGEYPGYKNFDANYFGITPREAQLMDPQQRKMLELSVEVLELGGYQADTFEGDIGVFAGMANNTYQNIVREHPEYISQVGEFNVMLGNEKDYIATRVAHKLNLTGPALSVHTGCSTSLVAVIQAVKSLRDGDCDMALAGGISISANPKIGYLFQEGGIFSKEGICRPFDKNSSGTIFNDGAGIVLLKRLTDAEKDQDNILAVVKGVGINNDGADKMSFTAPSVKGQAAAISRALKDGNIDPSEIGYIEAHGTATPVGDPIEVEGLKEALGKSLADKSKQVYLGSLKANLGHLTSAAGVAGLIKTVKVVREGITPAMANFTELNPSVEIDKTSLQIPKKNEDVFSVGNKRTAGISSFGVGGTNAHVIIQSYQNPASVNSQVEKVPTLIKLSAKNKESLEQMVESAKKDLSNLNPNELLSYAYTLEIGRKEFPYKAALVATNESLNLLKPAKNPKRELCFMFPGQGSQYLDMGSQLMESSGIFSRYFNQAADALSPFLDKDIKSVIFKKDKNLDEANEALKNTYYTQPAIFVIEYAIASTLLEMGIKPSVLIGHSVGEFAAACIAGVMSLEDACKMIAKRGELMRSLPKGSMLAVGQSFEECKEYTNDKIQIAVVNAFNSTVLAGPENEIRNLETQLTEKGISAKHLHTSHAFHSSMMDPVVETYLDFVSEIELSEPKYKIFSTVTNKMESETFTKASYWAKHMRESVLFAPAITNLINENKYTFLEIGPRTTLKSLGKKAAIRIKDKATQFIASLSNSPESEAEKFMTMVGELWQSGHSIDPDFIYPKITQRRVPAVTYKFIEKELWLETKLKNNNIEINKTGSANMSASTTKRDKLLTKLTEIFEEASGIDISEFEGDTCFLEMGMDSLFLTQVALNLKNELKIEINFRQLLEEYSCPDYLTDGLLDQVADEIIGADEIVSESIAESAPVLSSEPAVQASSPTVVANPVQVSSTQAPAAPQIQLSSGSGLESIINNQLALMQQQIQLLGGQAVSQTVSSTTNTMTTPVQEEIKVETNKVAAKNEPVKAKEEKHSNKAELNNSKKAFGAIARINTKKDEGISSEAKAYLDQFFKDYIGKTAGSKKFTQDNRANHADPRAVTGFRPESKEIVYPIVVEKSQDQFLWDVDGNRYVDMTCGFGSNFFGNGNKRIKEYVKKQLDEGIEIGPQHPLTADVSNLVNELTGNERTAFCNTGSEAVLGAMRIARTVSGKQKIIVFNGSYHGICDEVIIRGAKSGRSLPAAPGINSDAVSNMIVLEYGTEEALKTIREMVGDIAAVMVEPVQSRRSDFHPKEFLQEVRKITEENDTCLIFDEVITGFRIHPGGAQAYFDVRADICTYGKIVGGGMPIGVVSGKKKYLDALDGGHWQYGDDSTPTVGVTYFAGTFVRHPLALAAAKGALEIIKDGGVTQLDNLNQRAQAFVDTINLFCAQSGIPLRMDNFGSLMKPKWKEDFVNSDVFFAHLRYNGIHVYDGFPWFVNLAHTDEDLEFVISGFKKAVASMQLAGILPGGEIKNVEANIFNKEQPPVAGALLGKDSDGNPAWFVTNPEKPGEYLQVKNQ